MDTVELEKLHWTQDLPPLRRKQTEEVKRASWPTKGWSGWEWGYGSFTQNSGLFSSSELQKHLFFALTLLAPWTIGAPFLVRWSQDLSPERPGIKGEVWVWGICCCPQPIVLFLFPLEDAGPIQPSRRATGPRCGPTHPFGTAPPWRGGRGETWGPGRTGIL